MSYETFRKEMERQFGSDEALGIRFVFPSGEVLSPAQLDELLARPADAQPEFHSVFADGGSATCCTNYAKHIFENMPGRVQVYGFFNEDNPTSRIAKEEIHPGGHDFAVVDGRFIVDPWPRLVPMVFDQMVFDLEDPDEGHAALEIYGPKSCWERVQVVEESNLS